MASVCDLLAGEAEYVTGYLCDAGAAGDYDCGGVEAVADGSDCSEDVYVRG